MNRMLVLFDADELQMSGGAVGFARDAVVPFDLLWSGLPSCIADRWSNCGAERIFYIGASKPTAEQTSAIAVHLMEAGTSLAGPSTTGAILARVAGMLDLPRFEDVDQIDGDIVRCSLFDGRVHSTVRVDATRAVFSVKSTYPARPNVETDAPMPGVDISDIPLPNGTKLVSRTSTVHIRPPLDQARVVVAGGRSLRDSSSFELYLGKAADKLGAAIAASGGAVHSGIAPTEKLIGQTGQTVAPDLYLAVGIY